MSLRIVFESEYNRRVGYQIDQSGKIEQTERNTVVACVNGEKGTILLRKAEKRMIQKVFRVAGMQKLFPYLTFAALVAILIHKLSPKHRVIIDHEYAGHEKFIKERIEAYLVQLGSKVPPLTFGHVGKLSKAHQLAYRVAVGKENTSIVATASEVLKTLFGTKNRDVDRLTQEWIPGDRRSSRLKIKYHKKIKKSRSKV